MLWSRTGPRELSPPKKGKETEHVFFLLNSLSAALWEGLPDRILPVTKESHEEDTSDNERQRDCWENVKTTLWRWRLMKPE